MINFPLKSDEYELLLAFKKNSSISQLAQSLNKDPSVISRMLQAISKKIPVVSKRNGKWYLTDMGQQLNSRSNDFIQSQNQLLKKDLSIKIGTNTEFLSRIIGPQIKPLQNLFPKTTFHFFSFQEGTEQALLDSKIDIAIDCNRPYSPDISYKLWLNEPIVAVVNKSFMIKFKKQIDSGQLQLTPHLFCQRLSPDQILQQSHSALLIAAHFTDIAATRAACVAGAGWALLPRYAVKSEIEQKSLLELELKTKPISKYGIWHLRSRTELRDQLTKITSWLKDQSLE